MRSDWSLPSPAPGAADGALAVACPDVQRRAEGGVISSQWTSALLPLPPPGDGFGTDHSSQGLCEQDCGVFHQAGVKPCLLHSACVARRGVGVPICKI